MKTNYADLCKNEIGLKGFGLIIFATILFTFSCQRVKPRPPEPTALDSLLVVPVSTLRIPVRFQVADLESIVNTKLTGVFIHEWLRLNDNGDSLYIEVEKKDNIRFSWTGKRLYSSFPLKVSGRFVKRVAGVALKNSEPVQMQVVVYLSSHLDLSQQWHLEPQTQLEKMDWIEDPVLKIVVVKINLRKVVEEAIDRNKKALTAKLDEALSAELNTRKSIDKIWNDIQKPIRINKKMPEVWLHVYGRELGATVNDANREAIELDVVIRAFLQTSLNEKRDSAVARLPRKSRDNVNEEGMRVFIFSKIDYTSVNELLQSQLIGKTLTAEGYTARIDDMEIYGIDSGLAVKCKVDGDAKGDIYARATIGYDSLKRILYASEFRYDVETENALIRAANWLLYEDALALVNDELKFHLDPFAEKLPELISQGLEKGRVGEKIDVYFDTLLVSPYSMIITKNDIQVIVEATGSASIDLNEKTFTKRK